MRKAWTPDEDRKLLKLRKDGLSLAACGIAIGRSTSSCNSRARYLDEANYSAGRLCGECNTKPIRNDNLSGYCRSCNTVRSNRSPEMIAKRKKGWQKRLADPVKYYQLCKVAAANSRKAMLDPAKRAAAQQRALKIMREHLHTPEMMAFVNSPEMAAQRGRKVSEYRMAWCPPEYRELYYELRRKIQGRASEARRAVLDQIAKDEAALSPFERQERALKRGGHLIANDLTPNLANPGDFGERKWERLAG